MSVAAIWQAITLLIKYLPLLVEAIQKGEEFIELRIELKKVDDATVKAKQSKNTADLEALLNPPSNPGNPSDPGNH
jgi:hypothetical protein